MRIIPRPARGAGCRIAALAAAVLLSACDGYREVPVPLPRPLVVVAADGLEWRLVSELAGAGRLPALASIVSQGSAARLRTLAPAVSPAIWTSIATGVRPERHGVLGFVKTDAFGGQAPYTSRDRRVKAIWNIASDAGLASCVIGYWATFPAEELDGVMVAQSGAPPGSEHERTRKGGLAPGLDGQVHPPALAPRIFEIARAAQAKVGERESDLYGDRSDWPAALRRVAAHSRWSLEADTAYESIALDLASEPRRCALLIVYLGLPDVLGHRFWRWTQPSDFATPPAADEVARYGQVLRRAYEQLDHFVGELRRRAGDAATVVVVSDHGMGPWRPKAKVELERDDGPLLRTGGHSARRDAFVAAAGPGIAREIRPEQRPPLFGSVLDLEPTLLALLGLARGTDADGAVLTRLLDPVFVHAHPLAEVATHTPAGWQQSRRFAGSAELADPAAAERVEQLRGLGYLQ